MGIFVKWVRLSVLCLLAFLKWTIFLIITLLICQHLFTPVYHFTKAKPFSGNTLYNPYKDSKFIWLKMNLHAHSKAWGGVTDGFRQDAPEIYSAYKNLGYSIIGISNYHDPQPIYFNGKLDSLKIYEHGYNLFKAHRLVITTQNPDFFDVTFFHSIHDRQFILNRLKNTSEVTIIAHPKFGGGHTTTDFMKLSNYHLIEVLNHYRTSDEAWDIALSNGKPVFILGNDDMHDLSKPGEVAVCYTMVDSMHNLRTTFGELTRGNAYGVHSPDHNCDITLDSFRVENLKFSVGFSSMVDTIWFIGNNGQIKKTTVNQSSSDYEFQPEDLYVRVVAKQGTCRLFLNPVYRTNDNEPLSNYNESKIHWGYTICEKLFLIILFVLWVYLARISKVKIA